MEKEILKLIKKIGEDNFQEMANDWNDGECEGAKYYDWIVTKTIAHKLKQMSSE